jgi:dual specificity tyrosine-phosphorylation-regulated kinase 2/3/4
LLKSSDKSGIKIIDFGSSCFSDQKLYTYIQSRYYRAPEVILGYDYSTEIDIWSFGCVVAEMKLSYPIFSGDNEDEQVGLITEVIGLPKPSFYENTERGNIYFGSGSAPLRDRDGA